MSDSYETFSSGPASMPEAPAPITTGRRPARPPRRVGTFTLGVCLVMVGVLALIALFNPHFDFLLVAKCSPLILILLGIEVLIAYIKNDGEKIKYDFLSGIVCLLLIFASFGIACAVPFLQYFGPERYVAEAEVTQSVYDLAYDKLSSLPLISSLDVDVELHGIAGDFPSTYEQLSPSDFVCLYLELSPAYATKLEFAQACSTVFQSLSSLPLNVRYHVHIDGEDPNGYDYSLHTSDRFTMNHPAEELVAEVRGGAETP